MRAQRCKGTRDLSSEEMGQFRLIEGIFRESCLKWGYEEVRTSTIEYLHLFTATGTLTPNRLRRVYSFLDWDGWSGERVVLRPDGTIPIARFYIETMAEKEPAKFFYVTNVFGFEETGKETRERWQCGTEFIGVGSATADVALVTLALEIMTKLGLEGTELKLSHAGLIRTLLAEFGLSHEEQTKAFDQILDGDLELLARLKPERPELGRTLATLLDLKGKSAGFLKNMRSLFNRDLPELKVPFNNFIDIVERLEAIGGDYQIDITSGRGFEYYTGLMFQLFIGNEPVGGGGRYDALIPLLGGQDTPASGFALYIDRLMALIKPETLTQLRPTEEKILVKGELERANALKDILDLTNRLHGAGYTADVHLGGKEPANIRWRVEIQSKEPRYMLTDRISQRKFEAATETEVLASLNRKKRSPSTTK
ncbi:MAG: ATP phosphoribosyltransferase regulatory subunit [Dehalococcoidales bacterium]|nr:ATP phosphoribosyltransferase regulatory subunit [Dehalococcoidales bacterium]MDP7109594.1 ATP phosphoribosyltransferase regulatory subunit [Dehalococcoidales bacterium]MDP7310081.1 ATP phosphoribosyltransferase regulatory subunit [Dehalococcoidales bacterium]MDP7409603.1 ATP phosphoribosyltransferase regulatory subunit [Dehalococcoidales bacterium]MDP7675937.1 ATP phosphoribosyltransferase regulatory subunit [Dehalococcoidales bacterium]